MTVTANTNDNRTLLLQEERELHAKPWRFQIPVDSAFWGDIFDQLDHDRAPKTPAAAYKRDPAFWHWLVMQGADAAAPHTQAGAASRTVRLALPNGDPKSIYDRFRRL